jgi:hypothetical protein
MEQDASFVASDCVCARDGVTVPAVGWLLDKLEARFVISAGIVFAGSAFLIFSRAHSYGVILIA